MHASPPSGRSAALSHALRSFLATEVAGGVVLVVAAVAALVWANSPWDASYDQLWTTDLSVTLGRWELDLDVRHWVNDGLMALFFVVVSLEVKRELLLGELRDPRRAALPAIAALGGMVVPAVLYLAFAGSGDAREGWGIPMATDIAFAVGVAAILGRRLPSSLRLFLLTLAIVDDIGAIIVIAIFYSAGIEPTWLAAAAGIVVVVWIVRQAGVVSPFVFVALGSALWFAVHESGVHATLAGVAMGLLAPIRPMLDRDLVHSRADELLDVFSPEAARTTQRMARMSVSELEWLQHELHPWTSLVIVPIFALANAGIALDGVTTSSVTWAVVIGLVVGKPLGITAFSWVAVRSGLATKPDSSWPQLFGVAALAGIGFTVSLFVTGLAFDGALASEAKVGVLAASVAASIIGVVVIWGSSRRGTPHPPTRDEGDEGGEQHLAARRSV